VTVTGGEWMKGPVGSFLYRWEAAMTAGKLRAPGWGGSGERTAGPRDGREKLWRTRAVANAIGQVLRAAHAAEPLAAFGWLMESQPSAPGGEKKGSQGRVCGWSLLALA